MSGHELNHPSLKSYFPVAQEFSIPGMEERVREYQHRILDKIPLLEKLIQGEPGDPWRGPADPSVIRGYFEGRVSASLLSIEAGKIVYHGTQASRVLWQLRWAALCFHDGRPTAAMKHLEAALAMM